MVENYFEWLYSPVGTEQAKPLSGGETLLFSLLPPPFGAIHPKFVCKIFEIFENILEPSTLLRVCLQNICDMWNIREFFGAINPTFVIIIFAIFEIFENTNRPRSACVCKTLTVSPPSPAGTCCLNKRRETDHVSWRDRFQNIWRIWKYLEYLNEQQGATSADETTPIRRNAC